ncbi:MAG: hypothetical protein KDD66_09790 [Bdellovibrionales bacterium]|nr:hypothetical protein [Bdellovibrionales bacterium]
MSKLEVLRTSGKCSFYRIAPDGATPVARFVASTPETRAICNDPLIAGVNYTKKLRSACEVTLAALSKYSEIEFVERQTVVLNILRGGLNFGLREALADAFDWNQHTTAFVSAQRSRTEADSESWKIKENEYKKLHVPQHACVICGDVVATGTTLLYALKEFLRTAETEQTRISSLVFFTIGGQPAEEVLHECDALCRKAFEGYKGASIIYFEGRFNVAREDSDLTIKQTGTDLIRSGAIAAPEFISSQYDSPAFPLERCAIYDAGSRAFYPPAFYEDVLGYWREVRRIANEGVNYASYIAERFPELDVSRFEGAQLKAVCDTQIAKLERVL